MSLRVFVVLTILLGAPRSVSAEEVGLLPIPVLTNVQVQAQAAFDPALGLFRYGYTIVNPATNTGEIRSIRIDISIPSGVQQVDIFDGSLTIPFGLSTLTFDENLALLRKPVPMVPVGMRVPPGWNGAVAARGFAGFFSAGPGEGTDKVVPGGTPVRF